MIVSKEKETETMTQQEEIQKMIVSKEKETETTTKQEEIQKMSK